MRESLASFNFNYTLETIIFNDDKWELELENYLADYLRQNNIWCNPIKVSNNKWHVYGVSKITWKAIWIEVTREYITIMRWANEGRSKTIRF